MREAFGCIEKTVKALWDNILEITFDSYKSEKLTEYFVNELYSLYGIEELGDVILTEADYRFLTLRFTSDFCINYFRGDREKAIKKLEKVKDRTRSENRLLRIWKESESFSSEGLSAVCHNAKTYNDSGVMKNSFKEFLSVFLTWLVFTPFISLIYGGLFFFLLKLEERGSVYLMGAVYNLPFCFVLAFVTAIAVSYFFRNKAFSLLFKKDYSRYIELDSIANGGGSDKFMHVFLWLTVFVSICACILLPKWNINFKEDGFVDNREFFSVKGAYYEYSDIQRIYYKADRTNDFGDTLDYPSYVMELRDGTQIDFYDFDDIESYEKELFEHLEKKGVKIEKHK